RRMALEINRRNGMDQHYPRYRKRSYEFVTLHIELCADPTPIRGLFEVGEHEDRHVTRLLRHCFNQRTQRLVARRVEPNCPRPRCRRCRPGDKRVALTRVSDLNDSKLEPVSY
ncbi:MAG TPA: hypothetical protein VF815_11105, partial [Myxococcaceae bacterium]